MLRNLVEGLVGGAPRAVLELPGHADEVELADWCARLGLEREADFAAVLLDAADCGGSGTRAES